MTKVITQAIDDMCLGIAQLSWYASGCDGDEGNEALQAAKKLMASMKALQELKASVPEDVPEVCFGNIDDEVADCDSKITEKTKDYEDYESKIKLLEKDFANLQEDYFELKKRLFLSEKNEKDASEGWAEAEEELQYLKDNPIENMLQQGYSMTFTISDKEQEDE